MIEDSTAASSSKGTARILEMGMLTPQPTVLSRAEITPIETNHVTTKQGKSAVPEQEQPPPQRGWTNQFAGNRSAKNGMALSFIPPEMVNGKVVVKMVQAEIEQEIEKWSRVLIVYVVGETPSYNYMKRFIGQTWASVSEPAVYYHDGGYYIVRFQSKDEMNEILYSGPYSINNKPLIIKPWAPDFDLNDEFLTEIPLWVTFPKLLMSFWSCPALSRLASAIGIPLYAEECTTKQTRVSYARMLIQANVTKPLPDTVTIYDTKGRELEQGIEYNWKPEYCEACHQIGHVCRPKQHDNHQHYEQPRRKRRIKRIQQPNDGQSV
ncbi:uncharacterized protein LOC132619624 [Lycium barbarum]|uniref:uncharacterized protein LOC132619624 n=1 Tax=Lycium barbarum TaxID=112863 RepID=UPI00293E3294|nr:uncharacterized protein LOC132619624 [Lycium barbarum]